MALVNVCLIKDPHEATQRQHIHTHTALLHCHMYLLLYSENIYAGLVSDLKSVL